MRIRPAPADAKPAVSKAKALRLAARYSGFELKGSAAPELVTYSDRENVFCAERVKSPFVSPVLAWIFSERGVVQRGFSVPPGYTGPEPYGTCRDLLIDDKTGKAMGGGAWY